MSISSYKTQLEISLLLNSLITGLSLPDDRAAEDAIENSLSERGRK
jgi:hypothetical protein